MGACTVTLDPSPTHAVDIIRMMTGTITLSSSYAPGGDSWTAVQFGLNLIHDLKVESGTTLNVATIVAATSGTVKAFVTGDISGGVNVEALAGSNLSANTFRFMAWGW